MNEFIALVVYTANILGAFQDPFEFQGDYGPEVNPIREKVFELVVSKEALSKNMSDFEVQQLMSIDQATPSEITEYRQILVNEAREKDRAHGPTLSEVITPALINELKEKQEELQNIGFEKNELEEIFAFVNRYGDRTIFNFLRNVPSSLLTLDKTLHDKGIDLPILGSTQPLEGKNSEELKSNLLQQLFNKENLSSSKSESKIRASLDLLDPSFLHPYLGNNANVQELHAFSTPVGQIFFYWLYQALNLQLVSQDPHMIPEINRVKEIFAHTLGDSQNRAALFKEKLTVANAGVLFTQEADALVPQALTKDGVFHSIDKQNPQDGAFVFLRADLWEPDYQIIPLDRYEGYKNGRVNLILATNLSGEKFLLASAHGNSTRAEDGRLQIALTMEKFEELASSYAGLQLIIGIDANTKTEEDVQALREHLDTLGLIGTNVGPTTIKKRMVTSQHAKAGRAAIDEEDYLIILKPEKGGRFTLTQPTVGFSEEKPDINIALPNVNNASDHYPVGSTLIQQ